MKKAAVPSILVVVALLAVAVTVEAQQTGKVRRVGFLDSSTASSSAVLLEAFRQELSKFGWIEGKDIAIRATGRLRRLSLVAWCQGATRAAVSTAGVSVIRDTSVIGWAGRSIARAAARLGAK